MHDKYSKSEPSSESHLHCYVITQTHGEKQANLRAQSSIECLRFL